MRHVAIFARSPRPGSVKTRLHAVLGAELAARLYEGMLEDTLSVAARAIADRRHVYWADPDPPELRGEEAPATFSAHLQQGRDLGERLARAFEELVAAPEDRAAIVGADCPELGPASIDRALEELTRCDVVLGPARDGGYYLVALAGPAPELFADIPWGSAAVLSATLARAHEARRRVTLIEYRDDVDTPADVVRLLRCGAAGAAIGSSTRARLVAMGLLPAASRLQGRLPG